MRILKQCPMEYLRKKKYRLRRHKTLEVEQLKRWRYIQRNHKTLEEGVK
jgi:hypothetical protein